MKVAWNVPSNIALIKYWGKRGDQYPCNPSLSMGLCHSSTRTEVHCSLRNCISNEIKFDFLFHGKESLKFSKKIEFFLYKILTYHPFLKKYEIIIHSKNTFPHSSGIASSASFFASLSLCINQMSARLAGRKIEEKKFLKEASRQARLGSGSACRSIYGEFSIWGKVTVDRTLYSDHYALPYHCNFHKINDAILIVKSEEKKISSTEGHRAMLSNPYAKVRYLEAKNNMLLLTSAIRAGNWATFGEIVEKEALQLHALMMLSSPSILLITPKTLLLVQLIQEYRLKMNLKMYFTLDAGANIHLLYRDEDSLQVHEFIENYCRLHLENERVIFDHIGEGPTPR